MCDRLQARIDADLDWDEANRPILCGRLTVWLKDPPDGLTGGSLRAHIYNLDGWTLPELGTRLYELREGARVT